MRLCLIAVFVCVMMQASVYSRQESAREQIILQIQRMLAEQNLADARKLIDEAAKRFPDDSGFDNLLGIIEAQRGNYSAAEISFNRAISRSPKFTGAYLNLGRLYQEASLADPQASKKALDVYRRVLEYESHHAEANYQLASLLMRQGAHRDSLEHLSRLPVEAQASAQALSIRCADYAALGDRERAMESAARLVSHTEFSELDARSVLTTLTAGKHDEVIIVLLEGLLKRQPLTQEMMYYLGLAYERSGKLSEARNALERSVAGGKPTVALLLKLAEVAHKQRDFKGSLGYLAHASDLEPHNAGLHHYYGLVCVDLNLIAEAHSAFGKAVSIEPENPSFNYAMGAASAFRHDPAEAIPYFKKYIQLKPEDPRGKLALGAALFKAKDFDAAIKALMEAVKHTETAATAHYYLGSVARQQGRFDEAVRELEEALKSKPDYPDALAEIGQCYLVRKDYERSAKYLRRALEINPVHYIANFNLLTLYTRTKDERTATQQKRFEDIQKHREEKTQEFLRIVEVHPFQTR